jgi:putative hydrolase of the HAD superfamily
MVIVFDLDDTLYDEIDFVKSGFLEVSEYLGDKKYFEFMWNEFKINGSGKIFDKLIDKFSIKEDITKLIEIYRFHTPRITLPSSSKKVLKYALNYKSAIITDGHYITQKNKYQALGLDKYIDLPIFTDFYHTKKPELKPFKMVMEKFADNEYIYISDNPKKDFIAPKELGWKTLRYKNPNGIYKDIENNADIEVYSREEILKVLDGRY